MTQRSDDDLLVLTLLFLQSLIAMTDHGSSTTQTDLIRCLNEEQRQGTAKLDEHQIKRLRSICRSQSALPDAHQPATPPHDSNDLRLLDNAGTMTANTTNQAHEPITEHSLEAQREKIKATRTELYWLSVRQTEMVTALSEMETTLAEQEEALARKKARIEAADDLA